MRRLRDPVLAALWSAANHRFRFKWPQPTSPSYQGMQRIRAVVLCVLVALSVAPRRLTAQDSSRADWRAWFAIKDSVDRCRALPVVRRVYTYPNEYSVHRTASGGTCQVGPGPTEPTAWVVDDVLFCPDSSPQRWANLPDSVKFDPTLIDSVKPTRDSLFLHGLRCALRPRTAVVVGTRRRPASGSAPLNKKWTRGGPRSRTLGITRTNSIQLVHAAGYFAESDVESSSVDQRSMSISLLPRGASSIVKCSIGLATRCACSGTLRMSWS